MYRRRHVNVRDSSHRRDGAVWVSLALHAAAPLREQAPGAAYAPPGGGAPPAEWVTFAPFGEHGCTHADTAGAKVFAASA